LASAADQISRAVERVRAEVPALAKLRLVFGVELTAGGLTGPGESERFRVELPGPRVSEGAGDDERIRLSIPRTMFNLLAEEGELADWREAFAYGHLKVDGDPRVRRLLGRAIERSGER
jgi:hypothetical protein